MSELVDLSRFNYSQLVALRDQVTDRIKEMRDTGITQLRATIAEQAQILGIELKELVPRKTRRRRKSEEVD